MRFLGWATAILFFGFTISANAHGMGHMGGGHFGGGHFGGHFGGFHGFGHPGFHSPGGHLHDFDHGAHRGDFGNHHGGDNHFDHGHNNGVHEHGRGSHIGRGEHDFRDHVGPMDFGGPVNHNFHPEHFHGGRGDRDFAGGGFEGFEFLCPIASVASFATPYAAPLSIMCMFAD